MSTSKKNIVLGVTGSIAAYKAADIIRRLQDEHFTVSVIMTKHAKKFITPLTLASLSRKKIFSDMFDQSSWDIDHIHLAQEADLLLIAPATANIIGKIASGIADDLLTCTVLATKAPIFIAPAMNEGMYMHPIVQENCIKLQDKGVHFIDPIEGHLACGEQGKGHLAKIQTIIDTVKNNVP